VRAASFIAAAVAALVANAILVAFVVARATLCVLSVMVLVRYSRSLIMWKTKPINGDRLKVFVRLWPTFKLWTRLPNGDKVKLNKVQEARVIAEKQGFNDGIHIVIPK
jgi:hypothetical protein